MVLWYYGIPDFIVPLFREKAGFATIWYYGIRVLKSKTRLTCRAGLKSEV